MLHNLLTGFAIFCVAALFAQESESTSHSTSVEIGTGISPQWPRTSIDTGSKKIEAGTIPSIFPPVVYAGYCLNLPNDWEMSTTVGVRGLQNSFFAYSGYKQLSNYESENYIDSFLIRMNTISAFTNFRKFRYGEHGKGLYLFAGAGISFVFNTVQPVFTTIYTEAENPDNPYQEITTVTPDPWKQIAPIGTVRAGIGGQIPLFQSFYLDLGIQGTLCLNGLGNNFSDVSYSAKPAETNKNTYDYEENFRPIIHHISSVNFLRQFYSEFYVKIGYTL